jgi:hypothetical protein
LYKFGKKSLSTKESLGFVDITDKLSSTIQTLGAKTSKKCCHIDISEVVGL